MESTVDSYEKKHYVYIYIYALMITVATAMIIMLIILVVLIIFLTITWYNKWTWRNPEKASYRKNYSNT